MFPNNDDDLPDLSKFAVKTKQQPQGDESVARVVDDELMKLGWSENARLSLLGDLGRENSWNRKTIFGGHVDPASYKNGKGKIENRGIISWNGTRKQNLDKFLQKEGVYGKNDDDELRGMVRFMDSEMRDSPEWKNIHQAVRNPNISTYDASENLRKYIKYVPNAPYNTHDPDFRVKANKNWAKKAENLGLGKLPDLSGFSGNDDLPDLSNFAVNQTATETPAPTPQTPVSTYAGSVDDLIKGKKPKAVFTTNKIDTMPPEQVTPEQIAPQPGDINAGQSVNQPNQPVFLQTEDGQSFIQASNQTGLGKDEIRVRNTANPKGGIQVVKKVTGPDGKISYQFNSPSSQDKRIVRQSIRTSQNSPQTTGVNGQLSAVLPEQPTTAVPEDTNAAVVENDWTRKVGFSNKPDGISNAEWAKQQLIPEIVAKTGVDAIDVEKELDKGFSYISGNQINDIPRNSYFEFVMDDDFYAKLIQQNTRKKEGLTQFVASGQPLTQEITAEMSKKYGIDPREIEAAYLGGSLNPQDSWRYEQAAKQGKATRQLYQTFLGERQKQAETNGDTPDIAEIQARADAGWLPKDKAEEIINKKRAANQRYIEENPVKLDLEIAAQMGQSRGMSYDLESAKRVATAKWTEERANILKTYGGFDRYFEEQERIQREYKYRPLARPLEAAKGFVSALPQAAASVLKFVDVARETLPGLTPIDLIRLGFGSPFKATDGYGYQAGEFVNKITEYALPKNPDLQDYYSAGNAFGQVAVQVGAGILTGGAALPVAIGSAMGGVEQFDNVKNLNIPDWQKKLVTVTGSVAAISDAIPFMKFLSPLNKVQRLGFLNNFLNSVFKSSVKEVGEKEAIALTQGAFKRMLMSGANAAKTLGTGFVLEGSQELSEKKINDLVASLTYDPKRKVFIITNEDSHEFVFGGLGGIGGGIGEITLQNAIENRGQNLSFDIPNLENFQTPQTVQDQPLQPSDAPQPQNETLDPITARQQVNKLLELGYQPQQIDALSREDRNNILQNEIPVQQQAETGAVQPERDVTLEAQAKAMLDRKNEGAIGVLYTDGERVPDPAQGWIKEVSTPEGVIHVSIPKLKTWFNKNNPGKEFNSAEALSDIESGKIKVTDIIGGKVKEFSNTTDTNTVGGTAVVTVDAQGNELNATKISDNSPENLTPEEKSLVEKQKQLDKKRFGNAAANTGITSSEEIVNSRRENRPIQFQGIQLKPRQNQNVEADNETANIPVSENKIKQESKKSAQLDKEFQSFRTNTTNRKDYVEGTAQWLADNAQVGDKIRNENLGMTWEVTRDSTSSRGTRTLELILNDDELGQVNDGVVLVVTKKGEKPRILGDFDILHGVSSTDNDGNRVFDKTEYIRDKQSSDETAPDDNTVNADAHEAATSPLNDLPEPTPAQMEAGNFPMGHTKINGLDISIQIAKGGKRKGTNKQGKAWERILEHHYGDIKRTIGADEERIDVFVNDGTPKDFSGDIYIVDQYHQNGDFDEHKVMIGYNSEEEARKAYLSNYPKDWKGLGKITAMPIEEFKKWTKEEQTAPVGENAPDSSDKKVTEKPQIAKFENSLNIPRAEMPQIRREDFAEFKAFAESKGVTITEETANVADLKPTQSEYNPAQVAQLPERALEKPLMVSSDNRVLDGHNTLKKHQELGNKEITIRRISLPAKEALALMKEFPKTTFKNVKDVGRTETYYRGGGKVDILEELRQRGGKESAKRTGFFVYMTSDQESAKSWASKRDNPTIDKVELKIDNLLNADKDLNLDEMKKYFKEVVSSEQYNAFLDEEEDANFKHTVVELFSRFFPAEFRQWLDEKGYDAILNGGNIAIWNEKPVRGTSFTKFESDKPQKEIPLAQSINDVRPFSLMEKTWTYFDKEKFEAAGENAKYAYAGNVISYKDESQDEKFQNGGLHPVVRAYNFFAKLEAGEKTITPRAPVTVSDNGNGTYTVIDENATTQAIHRLNWKTIPVIIVPSVPRTQTAEEKRISELSQGVRAYAETVKDAYFADVQEIAAEIGGNTPNEYREFLVKSESSLDKKLKIKAESVPTDLLRTSIILPSGPVEQTTNLAYSVIELMAQRGYKIVTDTEGTPDFNNRFEDDAPGYKDVNIKFIKGENDPVVRELILIQPAMAKAKVPGHIDYDKVKDLTDRVKNSVLTDKQKEQLLGDIKLLNGKMAKLYAEAVELDLSPSINEPSRTIDASDSESSISGLAVKNWSKSAASELLTANTSASRLSSTERAAKFLDLGDLSISNSNLTQTGEKENNLLSGANNLQSNEKEGKTELEANNERQTSGNRNIQSGEESGKTGNVSSAKVTADPNNRRRGFTFAPKENALQSATDAEQNNQSTSPNFEKAQDETVDVAENATTENTKENLTTEKPRYEMTQAEYRQSEIERNRKEINPETGKLYPYAQRFLYDTAHQNNVVPFYHKVAIEDALKEGKPVPPQVLADYPGLAAKYNSAEATDNNSDFGSDNPTILKRTRDSRIESQMDDIEGADLGELLESAESAELIRNGNLLETASLPIYEIVRRAVEEVAMSEGNNEPIRFDALYLNPSQVKAVIKTLRNGAKEAVNAGMTVTDAAKLETLAKTIEDVAKVDGSTIVYLFDDAIPHELWHKTGYQESVDKKLAERHSPENLKTLANSEVVKKLRDGAFSMLYANASDAVVVEETSAWLAGGGRAKLNELNRKLGVAEISETEADNFLVDWALSFKEKNPNANLDEFAKINDYAKRIIEKTNRINDRASGTAETNRRNDGQGRNAEESSGNAPSKRSETESGESDGKIKTRQTVVSAEANNVVEKNTISGDARYYKVKSRDANVRAAQKRIEKLGLANAFNEALTVEPIEGKRAEFNAFLMELASLYHLQSAEAADAGDKIKAQASLDAAQQIITVLAKKGTDFGQAISQLANWQKTDPNAVAGYVQKRRSQNDYQKPLTPEEAKILRDSATEVSELNTKITELQKKIDELEKKIAGNKTTKRLNPIEKKIAEDLAKKSSDAVQRLKYKFGIDPILQMTAWHGSPHRFEKFDISYIGNGEGNQAYGHGLYFADREEIADWYKDNLSRNKTQIQSEIKHLDELISDRENRIKNEKQTLELINKDGFLGVARQQNIDRLNAEIKSLREKQDELRTQGGAKYKVDLKPSEDEYLLWDKPLNEQSEKVRKSLITESENLKEIVKNIRERIKERKGNESFLRIQRNSLDQKIDKLRFIEELPSMAGRDFYDELKQQFGAVEASRILHNTGIRGIKYLDSVSRDDGKGSFNYVIFDDADVEIEQMLQMARPLAESQTAQLDSEILKDFSDVGADILMRGSKDKPISVSEFRKEMSDIFGDDIRPHLTEIHALSVKNLKQIKSDAYRARAVEALQNVEGNEDLTIDDLNAIVDQRIQDLKDRAKIRYEHKKEANKFTKEQEKINELDSLPSFAKSLFKVADIQNKEILVGALLLETGQVKNVNELVKAIRQNFPNISPREALNTASLAARARKLAHDDLEVERQKLRKEKTEAEKESAEIKKERNQAVRQLLNRIKYLENKPPSYSERLGRLYQSALVSAVQTSVNNFLTAQGTRKIEAAADLGEVLINKTLRKVGELMGKELNWEYSDKLSADTQIANILGVSDSEDYDVADVVKHFFSDAIFARGIANSVLDESPMMYEALFGSFASDIAVLREQNGASGKTDWLLQKVEKGFDYVNALNSFQEFFIRSQEFNTHLQLRIGAKGLNLADVIKNNQIAEKITEEDLQFAVTRALRVTFALKPDKDTKFGRLINLYKDTTPGILSPFIITFPNFLYNATKFVSDYAPMVGLAKAGYKAAINKNDSFGQSLLKEVNPRVISQQGVGWIMFLSALALVSFAGDDDKWYYLKTPFQDSESKNYYIDVRGYQPFASMIFLANKINRLIDGKPMFSDRDIAVTETLEALTGFSTRNIEENKMLSSVYFATLGSKQNDEKDWDRVNYLFRQQLGDVVGGLLRPLKTVKDIVAQFNDFEAKQPDTKDSPFKQGIARSLPFANTILELEPRKDFVTGKESIQPAPGLKIFGVSIVNPETHKEIPTKALVMSRELKPDFDSEKDILPEARNKMQVKFDIYKALRNAGDDTDKLAKVNEAIEKAEKQGILKPNELERIERQKGLSELAVTAKQLNYEKIGRIYKVANEKEKEVLTDTVKEKAKNANKTRKLTETDVETIQKFMPDFKIELNKPLNLGEQLKRADTNKAVELFFEKEKELSGEQKLEFKKQLRAKAMNAASKGTLTDEELETIKKVIPEMQVNVRPKRATRPKRNEADILSNIN